MKPFTLLFAVFLYLVPCLAKTVTYDFNVTWVMANPDGATDRKVIGVNGQWPLPVIEVDKGDQLIVNMYNGLDRDASIHFHGMFQNGTNYMDGPNMVTQCPVMAGSSFTYNFTVNQNGTYWYHCHTDFCYPDGYRQALIVHDSDAYFNDMYEEEFTVTLSDWYHEMVEDIAPSFLSKFNPTGAEPIPNSFLFNDTMNVKIPVEAGKTYLFRLINTGAFTAQYFYIEDHTFQIVEVDGVYTELKEADTLYLGVAQRYAILVTMKNSTDKNYGIVTIADQDLFDTIPSDLQLNNTNWLQYNSAASFDAIVPTLDVIDSIPAFDDFTLVPYDRTPLLPEPDHTIQLDVVMQELDNGLPYAFLNDITYTAPKVPSLYTVLSSGNLSTDATVYGEYTNPFVLNHLDVVEVILNNNDTGTHPFHLHGHNFQVISRTPSITDGFYTYGDLAAPVPYDPNNHTAFPQYPIRRDVIVLPPQGSVVLRFVADNPGVWFFHCHIDWHLSQGLASVFIEAPQQMQERLTIPADHIAACKAAGVAYEGNAAANTKDYTDLSGQNKQASWIPYGGFTTKGIVAMVFSIISAIIGMIAITVYGLSDMKEEFKDKSGSLDESSLTSVTVDSKQANPVLVTPRHN
jgi:iron transport multicopper oxidase